jgi:c(7)-type cytochrome triheme protein
VSESTARKGSDTPPAGSVGAGRTRARPAYFARVVALALASACAACLVALASRPSPAAPATAETSAANRAQEQSRDFSKFSHASDAHRALACDSCHRRADNSAAPRLPGHRACTDCHLQQFVAAPALPMCAICHAGLESRTPPLKGFPRLASFNARFDHAQHDAGAARPEQGCAACHEPARRGVALTIPAGLDAHARCYACHTPQATSAGRDISSCGTCHALSPYARTSTAAQSFRVGFSHADHGPRRRLDCASCHTLRAGAAQGAQVSSPRAAQHFPPARQQSCATCHDGRRAFGGEEFGDCRRCHRGATFRF